MAGVIKKLGVSILGPCLIVVGLAMLVLPGPGLLTIAAGVAVLATEYQWARRVLQRVRRRRETEEPREDSR